jgi:cytochrome c553
MKLRIFISSLMLLSVFTACGNNDSEDNAKKEVDVTSASTPKIEVVENKNSHEIKVQEKKKTKLQVKDGKAYYYDYNIKSEYDQNAQPANKDASVRVKPRTAIEANMNVRSPYEEVKVSLLVRKLSKKFIVKCSACHNDYANGIIGPSLLGKDADFIFDKIADFKSGKKSNPLMNDLINLMSEKEIRDMAEEVYKFNQEIKAMRNK